MVIEIGLAIAGLIGFVLLLKALHTLYRVRQHKKALNGDYGDETQWATELVQEEDQMFILAVGGLSQNELMEVGVIAESKNELRELAIERYEERTAEQMPEDFA